MSKSMDWDEQWIGQRIQELRQARGMTQHDLAEAANRLGGTFHQQTIQKIEAGARPLRHSEAIKLTLALGVHIDALSGDKPEIDRQFAAVQAAMHESRSSVRELDRAVWEWLARWREAKDQAAIFADLEQMDSDDEEGLTEPLRTDAGDVRRIAEALLEALDQAAGEGAADA
ncbi:helix-turn-helix domain-containing protein [Rhodococcus sp. SJ-3]|uniref:helix-turn-helix domain-containing protein n=1 Tax=Rhodococcus sp. SJ-3 TaxID=3454628 RepID=UPI003F7AA2E1